MLHSPQQPHQQMRKENITKSPNLRINNTINHRPKISSSDQKSENEDKLIGDKNTGDLTANQLVDNENTSTNTGDNSSILNDDVSNTDINDKDMPPTDLIDDSTAATFVNDEQEDSLSFTGEGFADLVNMKSRLANNQVLNFLSPFLVVFISLSLTFYLSLYFYLSISLYLLIYLYISFCILSLFFTLYFISFALCLSISIDFYI